MHQAIKQAADTVRSYTTQRFGGVPGVVAMATDCNGNIYEGASGNSQFAGGAKQLNAKRKGTRSEHRSLTLLEATGYCCLHPCSSILSSVGHP